MRATLGYHVAAQCSVGDDRFAGLYYIGKFNFKATVKFCVKTDWV